MFGNKKKDGRNDTALSAGRVFRLIPGQKKVSQCKQPASSQISDSGANVLQFTCTQYEYSTKNSTTSTKYAWSVLRSRGRHSVALSPEPLMGSPGAI